MIAFLKYWKLAAVALLLLGAWVHGSNHGADRIQAKWDAATVQALAEQNRLIEQARAKENANSLHVRNLEAEYVKKIDVISAGRDDFAKRLRDAQARCNRPSVPSAADHPGRAENPPARSHDGPGSPDTGSGVRLRDAALKLQETVRLCVAWANEVGR